MGDIARFRKKPVEIEAWRVPSDTGDISAYVDEGIVLAEWCGGVSYLMAQDDEPAFKGCEFIGPHLSIETLEGTHAARPGEWIILGVAGEFYPCKPEIFERAYEPRPPSSSGPGTDARAERAPYDVDWIRQLVVEAFKAGSDWSCGSDDVDGQDDQARCHADDALYVNPGAVSQDGDGERDEVEPDPRVVPVTEATFMEGVRCVVMPCCAFTFDAAHVDQAGETYTCPNCDPPVPVAEGGE